MMAHIYNSLSKKKETLQPVKGKTVNMYTCGVTVYDKCHIGHARSLYIFDVIRRYLGYRGYTVNFVRNITDIDDKIINRAKDLNKTWQQVSKENIELYHKDLELLGIERQGIKEPKATDNIPGMIRHIQGLIEKGYAYEAQGDVYFSVRKFKGYGKLSGQSTEQMLDAVRIEKDEKKKDPLDFALWKKSAKGEDFWDSPWGNGRPGWHIECSVMSLEQLNCKTLDIHGGGRDLIFPHHENEIAQAEALTGKPFAKYWIHHGLLTIDGHKMAKSLGNFITIEDAVGRYSIDDLRLFFLSAHYASAIDFSEKKMEDMHKARERFDIFFNEARRLAQSGADVPTPRFIEQRKQEFFTAMDDDFNTPRALGALFEIINDTYRLKDKEGYAGIIQLSCKAVVELAQNIFGLFDYDIDVNAIFDDIKNLLEQRADARKNKDFKRSDEIRDELKSMGIIVEDGKDGQAWRRA